MSLALRAHAGDEPRFRAIAAQHCELPGINAGRAILAGLVHAKHRGGIGAAVAGPPTGHALLGFKVRSGMSAAPQSERMAFQPAMEMPRKRNCTWSQPMHGACVICFNSSDVVAPDGLAVQVVKPSKIFASTPA